METLQDKNQMAQHSKLDYKTVKNFDSSNKIKLSLDNTKSKVEFKTGQHKKGRMKVTLKFSGDEAQGFTNFCKLAKPDGMSQDDFVKFLFYKGVEALQKDFAAKVEEFKQNNPEEYAKLKAEVDATSQVSEGSVTLADGSNDGTA